MKHFEQPPLPDPARRELIRQVLQMKTTGAATPMDGEPLELGMRPRPWGELPRVERNSMVFNGLRVPINLEELKLCR